MSPLIMDGNNRWAKNMVYPVWRVIKAWSVCVMCCVPLKMLTFLYHIFAFSSENWQRPRRSGCLDGLFSLCYLTKKKMKKKGELARRGDRARFSPKLAKLIDEAEVFTAGGERVLSIAADYGGRWDIANTAKKLASLRTR